jgi:hypothetical protein
LDYAALPIRLGNIKQPIMDDPGSLRDRAARLRQMARSNYGDHRDTLIAAAAELEISADALDADASDADATAPASPRPSSGVAGSPNR